jgi:Elongator subunit Iki1
MLFWSHEHSPAYFMNMLAGLPAKNSKALILNSSQPLAFGWSTESDSDGKRLAAANIDQLPHLAPSLVSVDKKGSDKWVRQVYDFVQAHDSDVDDEGLLNALQESFSALAASVSTAVAKSKTPKASASIPLVVDSIDSLLLRFSASRLCRWFAALESCGIGPIVVPFTELGLETHTVQLLDYCASGMVTIVQSPPRLADMFRCLVMYKRSSGKVSQQYEDCYNMRRQSRSEHNEPLAKEHFLIKTRKSDVSVSSLAAAAVSSAVLSSSTEAKTTISAVSATSAASNFRSGTVAVDHQTDTNPSSGPQQTPVVVQAQTRPDPTANLSFNMRLTDKQKTMRANTPLPYTQARQPAASSVGLGAMIDAVTNVVPSGTVTDSDDDSDSSDPDDDLDI